MMRDSSIKVVTPALFTAALMFISVDHDKNGLPGRTDAVGFT
jgi:hypothetical protein